jgi:hypothetical protein
MTFKMRSKGKYKNLQNAITWALINVIETGYLNAHAALPTLQVS